MQSFLFSSRFHVVILTLLSVLFHAVFDLMKVHVRCARQKLYFIVKISVLSFFVAKLEIACTNGGIPLIFICCIAGSQVSL